MEYTICELDKLRLEYPNFAQAAVKLKTGAIDRAAKLWPGFTYGGLFPGVKQFGITTALPKFFKGFAGVTLATFRQNITATGWQTIFDMTVEEDIILGGMGFGISQPTTNLTEIRLEIGDKKYPRINLEEANVWKAFAVILRQGWIAEQETPFKLRGYFEATGYQRIVPINSFTLYKRKDLVITES